MIFDVVKEPWWSDRPLFIVGGGPSLRGRNLHFLGRRGRVLGVNRAAVTVPCSSTFTLDATFLKRAAGELERFALEGQEVFVAVGTDHDEPRIPGVKYLERRAGHGLSIDPRAVVNGLNSGYGALNLAILKLAKEIYLLGFDLVPPAKDEPMHWHDGYGWTNRSSLIYYGRWAAKFDEIAAVLPSFVKIHNANPSSAIRCFPFTTYEELGL